MVKSTDSDSDLEILGEEGISTPSSNTSKADVVANIRSQFAHSSNYEAPERKRGNLGHKHSAAQIKILEARFQQIRAEEKRDGRKQRAHLCREDKQDLCKKTGLSDLQVRLWFMNRRRKQLKSEQKATLRLLDPESAILNSHNLSAHPEITILDPPATTSMPAAINPKPQTSYITVVPRTPSTNVPMATHLGGLQANIQKLAVLASQVPQVSSTASAISSIQRPPVREANFNAKLKVGSRLFAVNKENLTKSSKYFEALFLIHSKDPSNANNPVEVNGVDSGDLEHFLSALRTDGLSITSENVCTLLKLSDRFDVPSLLTKCETFLGSNKSE
uniref:Homeobox domain-containing protein n=1 Tax=Acrobeloides nanus TaxID=290746 RepID=A0A914DI60_9BILA